MPNNDISNEQISRGLWLVEHKPMLKRLVIIALIAFDAITVGVGAYGFGDWLFGSGMRERAQIALLTTNLTDYPAFRQRAAPKDIAVEDVAVISSGTDRYDIAARASNANVQWWVEFDYAFADAGDGAQTKHGFLLPGEAKYLHVLALRSGSRPSSPRLEVTNIVWHRVNLHETRPDYATWSSARLDLAVSDVTFVPPQPGDALPISRATFTVLNDTAFGYRSVGFFVRLLSGSRAVGVNYVVVSDFKAGESRQVDATWFSELPNVTRVEVQPDLNIFDVRQYSGL